MKATVTKPFKGRAAGSQHARTYKAGDIIEDPRVAEQAIRSGRAVPAGNVTGKQAPANKAATPPENKVAADPQPESGAKPAAEPQSTRDPRAPAPPPAPMRGERQGRR